MRVVGAACGASLAIGLFFIFLWAPHPWGWEGFDHYHWLALTVAGGQGFPTMDVPWGYAYFLAFFYRVFGDHPWIPLTVQAVLNALLPLLVFLLARTWFDRRTAVVAAVITGLFSFNTVYASTQSSDAVCTVIFMTAVLAFVRALTPALKGATPRPPDRSPGWFAVAGLLTGIAPQFRPNLILIPAVLAAYLVWTQRSARAVRHAAVLLAAAALALAPWVVRNYRLTRTILPTSVHGGVQLWYGTLQVGPYLNSRAYNPRSVFEGPAFDYTSLADVSILVTASRQWCAPGQPVSMSLVYWTDHDSHRRAIDASGDARGPWEFAIPAPHRDAVVYFYIATRWSDGRQSETPRDGSSAPIVYFVTQDHLGDQDLHGDLVDVFDLVRAARAARWHEPVPFADKLRAAGVRPDDPAAVARVLAAAALDRDHRGRAALANTDANDREISMRFADGSSITIPKEWSGRITDLEIRGGVAEMLMHTQVSVASLQPERGRQAGEEPCGQLDAVAVNDLFYRHEPHLMRRYSALAWDNIRRSPIQFAVASAYRALRLFVVYGTGDPHTTQQFSRGRVVYLAATTLSGAYLLLFLAGVVIAVRRHAAFGLPLLLVLYVPATIAPVLTNMRYTVTVQPLVFMFVAVACVAAVSRRAKAPAAAGPSHAGIGTARRP